MFYSAYIEGVTSPSFIIPINKKCKKCNNKCNEEFFAVGVDNKVLIIKWNGKSTKAKVVRTLFEFDMPNPLTRTNYARADRMGRFYGGTFMTTFCNATATSSMYRYTKSTGLVRLFGDLKSTTGIVFNEKTRKMYHGDTCQLTITEFDWDPETGDICNGRVVLQLPFDDTFRTNFPIGLDIDSDGYLWFGTYNGQLRKFDPWTGEIVDTIDLSFRASAGIAFGGPNHDIMYVVKGSKILDVISASIVGEDSQGTSLLAVTGLNANGVESSRLNIKKNKLRSDFNNSCKYDKQ